MLNPKAFAHALTVVTAVFYVVCWLVSYVAPDFVFGIATSWFHTVNLESVKATTQMDLVTALWGLVSISVLTWVTTYASIWLYNYWAKKS